MKHEYLLEEDEERLLLEPILYPDIWEFYKTHQAAFWKSSEIDLSQDQRDIMKLPPEQLHFIKVVLAFFAASDGIVSENLSKNFINEIKIPEAKIYYGYQMMMENIHSEVYSLFIDTFEKDSKEKRKLFNGIQNFKGVKAKADWAMKWLSKEKPFGERLVAFAAVEGILFSASFAAIFYFKNMRKLPGLCFSNELIARDEGIHTRFACNLFVKHLQNKPSYETVKNIIEEAVETEKIFIKESLPKNLIGMNAELMIQYVCFVADVLMEMLDMEKIYHVENPFDWMEMISLTGKTNFFDKRVGDYQKVGVKKGKIDDENFSLDENF